MLDSIQERVVPANKLTERMRAMSLPFVASNQGSTPE